MRQGFDPRELSDFARYYGFHYDSLDPEALAGEVEVDMGRGLEGLPSSLPMIPSYIAPGRGPPAGKTVLALDAGGTNLRASRVSFDGEGGATAGEAERRPMPGSRGRASATEFFDAIADAALPALGGGGVDGIGFTFSYHMDMRPDADGVLRAFSKEIDAPEVVGMAVGAGLREALARRGRAYDGPISLLNDTAATLLSGIAAIPGGGGPVVGFILGTGLNTAYPEPSIPKIGFESAGSPQIVVCESGGFRLRYRGDLDREFDAATRNPGAFTLEKTASGAYIGPLTMHILKRAVRDGAIRLDRADEFLALEGVDTRAMNEFLCAPFSAGGGPLRPLFGPGERGAAASALYLASIVAERGAALVAAALAATARRAARGGGDPLAPVRIAVEGTAYMAYKGMRRAIEARLHGLLARGRPLPYVIAPVEQASLIGAAVAAAGRA